MSRNIDTRYPAAPQCDVARTGRQRRRTPSRRSTSTRCSISTAAAEVDGVQFDGVDLFLSATACRHRFHGRRSEAARRSRARGTWSWARWSLPCGLPPAAARRWERPKSGSAFSTQVRKACAIGKKLRELGIRHYGVVRIDSATSPAEWAQGSAGKHQAIAETFREACAIAEGYGERLAAEGEICWGGMHSWKRMVELLEMVDRPKTLGFQADMAHTLLLLARLQRAGRSPSSAEASTGRRRTR